jgi:ribosomal protein L25 (general stress protein Ctc)
MNKPIQTSATWSDTLKTREAHLNALLKTINAGREKSNLIQTLTINAIKSEITHIDCQLKRRKQR